MSGAAELPTSSDRIPSEVSPVPIFHPALLALYPLLGLYAHNADKTPLEALLRPAIFLVALAALLTLGLGSLYRHRYKGGLAASIIIVAVFSGWSVFTFLMNVTLPYIAGYPNWIYYIFYGILLAGLIYLLVRLPGLRPRSQWRSILILALFFIALAVVTDGLLARVYSRGPAWYMALYVVAVCGALIYVARAPRKFRTLTVTANWFGVALIALSFLNILYNRPAADAFAPPPELPGEEAAVPPDAEQPDIYFLVVGGHGRSDVHRTAYGYNETPFIRTLEEMGFDHVPQSIANYPNTVLSLASCLNMDYLQKLPPPGAAADLDLAAAVEYVHNNRVYDFLHERGYRLLVFSQGAEALEPRGNVDEVIRPRRTLNEFEIVLLNSSALAPVGEAVHYALYGSRVDMRHVFERSRIYHVIDRLERLPAEPSESPRFVFAYLTLPEPPFLFTRDEQWPRSAGTYWYAGRPVFLGDREDYRRGYREQLAFTNDLIERLSKRIIESSERPVAIIIASAHGPGSAIAQGNTATSDLEERFANLIMLRLPNNGELPDQMSLVNLFRVTFNKLFGTNFSLLPDSAYMVDMRGPFRFEAVTEPVSQ